MTVFSENLRRRADELEISNSEVARRCGLSERRYAHYVNGAREPDLGTLVRIAHVLKLTIDELVARPLDDVKPDRKSLLIDRIALALDGLPEETLDYLAIQIQALAAR